jgi:hypothetical protein
VSKLAPTKSSNDASKLAPTKSSNGGSELARDNTCSDLPSRRIPARPDRSRRGCRFS